MQTRVPKEKDGLMLSQYLIQTAGDVPMWAIRETIKKRDIRIDGVRISGDVRVNEGQEIRVFWPKSVLSSEKKALPMPEIVFEDEHVLLVNKPQGIASQNEDDPLSGDSALTRTIAYLKEKNEKTLPFFSFCSISSRMICARLASSRKAIIPMGALP